VPLFGQAPLGRRIGRLRHEALREEVHCFVNLNDTRGSSDCQRADRSAAMHLLQCNMEFRSFLNHHSREAALLSASKTTTRSMTLAKRTAGPIT
jgi:hypothetical protein